MEKTISRLAKRDEQCFCAAKLFSRPCPRWVISKHCQRTSERPLYPRKRTSPQTVVVSALCQKRIYSHLTARRKRDAGFAQRAGPSPRLSDERTYVRAHNRKHQDGPVRSHTGASDGRERSRKLPGSRERCRGDASSSLVQIQTRPDFLRTPLVARQ